MLDAIVPTRTLATLAALVALVAAGCSDEPTGPDAGSSGTPRTGSTYTMHRFDADTTGAPIAGSGDTIVTTLVATDGRFGAETGVRVYTQGSDTVALLRDAGNGDLLYYPAWQGAALVGWISLPITTRSPTERVLRDTTIDLGGGQTGRSRVTLEVAYVSTHQVTVGDRIIEAHEVRIRIVGVHPLTPDQNLTETSTHTVRYAPAIGYFVRIETGESQQSPFSTITGPTAVSALTRFELK